MENIRSAVKLGYLAILSSGENGFELAKLKPDETPVPELQFILNKKLQTTEPLLTKESFLTFIESEFNIQRIIFFTGKDVSSFKEKHGERFDVSTMELIYEHSRSSLDPFRKLQELCSSKASLLIGFNLKRLRKLYLRNVGCAMALRDENLLDSKLRKSLYQYRISTTTDEQTSFLSVQIICNKN